MRHLRFGCRDCVLGRRWPGQDHGGVRPPTNSGSAHAEMCAEIALQPLIALLTEQ